MGLRTVVLRHCSIPKQAVRCFHSNSFTSLQNGPNGPGAASNNGRSVKRKNPDRDVFLSILSATTTRRDAKSYLSRFKPKPSNTGSKSQTPAPAIEQRHIALLKIMAPETLDDEILDGVGRTLSQLERLGLQSVVVVDVEQKAQSSTRTQLDAQVDRLVRALQKSCPMTTRRLDSILGSRQVKQEVSTAAKVCGTVEVQYSNLLYGSLAKGTIPVIPPIAYRTDTQRVVDVLADDVVLALTKEFAGLTTGSPQINRDWAGSNLPNFVLDRIIILDPLGGLPSTSRPDEAHIFVNLEQEYKDVRNELLRAQGQQSFDGDAGASESGTRERGSHSLFGASNPISAFLEEEISGLGERNGPAVGPGADQLQSNRHIQNLDLVRHALRLLPTSASALLTTPYAAATVASSDDEMDVRTRRPRNPLIFNLLTDKPLVSSSLPSSRLNANSNAPIPVTFFKQGMPLTIIPDPRTQPWAPPSLANPSVSLSDPRIDRSRLFDLIEDSFSRRLDVSHYLARTAGKIAGVIVAGEYEGGAILTWELPPGVVDDGSEESRRRMVPYLDKFAVKKRSQGAGGVADILFTAMVRTGFPQGVCWRSRKDNPVNKWYFERSAGTIKLPDSKWTMFWTTEGLDQDRERFLDYESVCRNIGASWADNNQLPE